MDERIIIRTTFTPDTITQRVAFDTEADGITPQVIMDRILRLEDEAVRKALTDLGWTPPTKIALLTH